MTPSHGGGRGGGRAGELAGGHSGCFFPPPKPSAARLGYKLCGEKELSKVLRCHGNISNTKSLLHFQKHLLKRQLVGLGRVELMTVPLSTKEAPAMFGLNPVFKKACS